MVKHFTWFKALPFWLALRLLILSAARKVTSLPITFSFSQGAEDILLGYLLPLDEPGNFVDVGCNAPVKFSNTFNLYLLGWRGINIDANEDLIKECSRVRRHDVCLQAAVSDTVREVTFHKGKDDAVSTIDEKRIVEWKKHFEFSEDDQQVLMTRTLTSILDEYWCFGPKIDLLNIDVEGHDLNVLRSLDLTRYRPKVVIIEMHRFEGIAETEIYRHLVTNGYTLKYLAVLNAYFVDESSSG